MKNIYHALGLKYTIYSMPITEICFFQAVSTSKKEQNCRFYEDWYLKGATFTNNNYIPSLPYIEIHTAGQ